MYAYDAYGLVSHRISESDRISECEEARIKWTLMETQIAKGTLEIHET